MTNIVKALQYLQDNSIAHSMSYKDIFILCDFWGTELTLCLHIEDGGDLKFNKFTRKHPSELSSLRAKGQSLRPGMELWNLTIREITNNTGNDTWEE